MEASKRLTLDPAMLQQLKGSLQGGRGRGAGSSSPGPSSPGPLRSNTLGRGRAKGDYKLQLHPLPFHCLSSLSLFSECPPRCVCVWCVCLCERREKRHEDLFFWTGGGER